MLNLTLKNYVIKFNIIFIGGVLAMGQSKADTAGGAGVGAVVGGVVGGPLGALIGGAIGGLIGGKNIVNGVVGAIEKRSGELSRDSRLDSEKRAKFSDMHEKAGKWREDHRDW